MKLETYLSCFSNGPWTGPDADLVTSVAEYNLAWSDTDPGERFHPHEIRFAVLFLYPHGAVLDWSDFNRDTDVFQEYDWVDWESLFSSFDTDRETFAGLPLEQKIYMLFQHYGAEEIFGTPYNGCPIDSASYCVFHGGTWTEYETREQAEEFARTLSPDTFESLERQDWLTGTDTTLEVRPLTESTPD